VVHLKAAEVSEVYIQATLSKERKTYFSFFLLSDVVHGERFVLGQNLFAIGFRSDDWDETVSKAFKPRQGEFILEDSRYKRSICSNERPFVSGTK